MYKIAKGVENDDDLSCEESGGENSICLSKTDLNPIVVPQSLNTRRVVLHGICQFIVEHEIQGKDNYQKTGHNLEEIKFNVINSEKKST